jgi:hypothetical protein
MLAYGVGWAWLTPDFEQSRLAVETASAAHAAMLHEENGLRGYLLARDASFLAPFSNAVVAVARAHAALPGCVGSAPELISMMLNVRLAEERWVEGWARSAAVTKPYAIGPSLSQGKSLFDAYRIEQTALANALDRNSAALFRREQFMIAARVSIELIVLAAILVLALRQHRALRDAIVVPVAVLLELIRSIRDMAGITASFGVAGFSSNTQTPRALLEAADAAMYESKNAGRNP